MPYTPSNQYLGGIRPLYLPRLNGTEGMDDVAQSVRDDVALLVYGPVGTGKTTLMAEVDFWTETRNTELRKDPNRRCPAFFGDEAWPLRLNLWTTAGEFCEDVKTGFKLDVGCDLIAPDARRLFLDDLGVERETPHNTDAISALLYARYSRDLPTWITTNLSLDDLRSRYGERVFSRIFDRSILVELTGADRRLAV